MIHITNDYLNLKQKRRINRTSRQEADRTNIPNTHVNYFEDGLDHVRLPFAYKLHILLCDMEAVGNEHIISWVEDGNAFKIHDPHTFKEIIQPRYFRQSKTSSFVRQVNIATTYSNRNVLSCVCLILEFPHSLFTSAAQTQ